jgi:hypothetical protein
MRIFYICLFTAEHHWYTEGCYSFTGNFKKYMTRKVQSLLVLGAFVIVGAPFAFANEQGAGGANRPMLASTTRAIPASLDIQNSPRFQEMLAKARGYLERGRQNSEHGTTTRATSTRTKWEKGASIAAIDASCVQKAVDTREIAVQSVFNESNATINDALKARQAALYAAWGMTSASTTSTTLVSARNVALKNAWNTWRDARAAAAKTLKTGRDAAWTTFKTTVKDTCKAPIPHEDEGAGQDTLGQTAI